MFVGVCMCMCVCIGKGSEREQQNCLEWRMPDSEALIEGTTPATRCELPVKHVVCISRAGDTIQQC